MNKPETDGERAESRAAKQALSAAQGDGRVGHDEVPPDRVPPDGVPPNGVPPNGVPPNGVPPKQRENASRLPGGLVVWIFVAVELLTFGAFLAAFAEAYASEPLVFRDSQALLHPLRGMINTAVLLTGSWLVARSLVADSSKVSRWLFAAGLSGVVFMVIKISEYVDVFSAGISMGTNSFWFYYLFLTFMHLLHVAFGVGAMFWLGGRAVSAHSKGSIEELMPSLEAGAVYWHLVDLIWIVLFPTIYLMHVL